MANTIFQFEAPEGLTLTLDLFPEGSDTATASAKACTEETNREGVYLCTVSEAATGSLLGIIKNSGVTLGHVRYFDVSDDTNTYLEDVRCNAPTAVEIRQEVDSNSTQLTAIVADTNELQTDDVPGLIATLDAVVDTVKAETALIVADTNELQTDDVPGLIAALDAVVDTVKAETALIVADTNELQTDDVPGLIAALDAVVDTVKAETALIVADTNELQTDWADGGRLDLILDSAASAGDPWSTALPGAYGAGTAGEIIGDWKNAGRLDAILDTIAADTTTDIPALIATAQADLDIITGATGVNLLAATQASIDAIEADTNELQTDDVPGLIAALDAVVDTVKAETALIVADTNELQTDDVPGLIAALDAVVDTVKAETALIVADTNELQTDWADGGRLDTLLDTAAAGGGGGGDATEAKQDTIIAALAVVDGIVDDIIIDTSELQTDWADGGRLDTLLDTASGVGAVNNLATESTIINS